MTQTHKKLPLPDCIDCKLYKTRHPETVFWGRVDLWSKGKASVSLLLFLSSRAIKPFVWRSLSFTLWSYSCLTLIIPTTRSTRQSWVFFFLRWKVWTQVSILVMEISVMLWEDYLLPWLTNLVCSLLWLQTGCCDILYSLVSLLGVYLLNLVSYASWSFILTTSLGHLHSSHHSWWEGRLCFISKGMRRSREISGLGDEV